MLKPQLATGIITMSIKIWSIINWFLIRHWAIKIGHEHKECFRFFEKPDNFLLYHRKVISDYKKSKKLLAQNYLGLDFYPWNGEQIW
ncbi:hypothetical protein [Anabaena azotica]|uniref:Uncharacterized protein n=1 Tax=Anabaena azotica FACHB-119 TaxID=947527 RepID=A0ABR8D9T9_9NOST|nr:hypothetical protein [Anabaena azotica]MBD2503965.1 hypothetical protein [Anabaena azotica FACHB-119]